MHISIATVFPHLYRDFLDTSLIKRSQENGIVEYDVVGFSSFCEPKVRIDSPVVGHGSGMAIRPELIEAIVQAQEKKYGSSYKIFLTPQGVKLDQKVAKRLAQTFQEQQHIMFFAGRYEGIDQRAHEEYADLELSIGDYILMGGDLAAMVVLESVMRYIPGVVAKKDSVENDSFTGPFVDFPVYATPSAPWKNRIVPEILISGNHKLIEDFRKKQAVKRSVVEHFQWVRSYCVDKKDKELVSQAIPYHYVALMHDQVIVDQGKVGTSSVTSLDIHDIARSCATYGVKHYFLVTPLIDQQKIANTILHFWNDAGIAYNHNRAEAVSKVSVIAALDKVIETIEAQIGKKPLLVATSAKVGNQAKNITFYDQSIIWSQDRPVLFIFGTAKGLSDELIKRCDYLLIPVEGFSEFNHLSVRSAVAVVLDRWMGNNNVIVD